MKKIILLIVISCLFLQFSFALSESDKEYLGSHGMVSSPFFGDFEQVKGLKNSNFSLKSGGKVEINPDFGVLWNTEKPYKSLLIVTKDHITQKIRENAPIRLDMKGNSVYTLISEAISSVFFGNFDVMESSFRANLSILEDMESEKDSGALGNSESYDFSTESLSSKEKTERWILDLIPQKKELSSFVKSICVKGGKNIESILLTESNGDTILYKFKNMENGVLSTDEVWAM